MHFTEKLTGAQFLTSDTVAVFDMGKKMTLTDPVYIKLTAEMIRGHLRRLDFRSNAKNVRNKFTGTVLTLDKASHCLALCF
jgi:DNA-binding response OmpR family regulator